MGLTFRLGLQPQPEFPQRLAIDFGGRRGKTMKELEKRPSFQGRYALFVAIDLSDRIAHNRPDNPLIIGPNLQRGFRLVALENRPDITIGIPGPGFFTLPWPARPSSPICSNVLQGRILLLIVNPVARHSKQARLSLSSCPFERETSPWR